ncbi:unnamed protein product [Ectocarpus sp. CCAP 1310/34]|nr:unnamed protein product [Ectocarpus sp. CCAP 1310/34]
MLFSLKQPILHDERGAALQIGLLFAREEKASAAYAMRLPYDPSATIVDPAALPAFVTAPDSAPAVGSARSPSKKGGTAKSLVSMLLPSLGGNLYLFVAVDSASRWNKVYGLRRKSDALAATKRLLADVGRYNLGGIECFRVDNGTEWTRGDFRRFCDDHDIGVEFTPPGVPQYNVVVESAIWRIMKAGMAARRSAGRVFNVDFASIPGLDERGDRLWMESAKWAADALNQSATKANPGRRSPHEMFTGEQGPFRVLPFFQPGFMREDRRTKLDDQATLC